jgi:hypothetical protein
VLSLALERTLQLETIRDFLESISKSIFAGGFTLASGG